MKRSPKEVIVEEFREAVDDVFTYHAGEDTDSTPTLAEFAMEQLFEKRKVEEMVSAKISLQGEAMSCTCCLIATSETIEDVANAMVVCSLDWIGELSNLLLGSFKNKLSEYNVVTQLGLPSTRPGIHLELLPSSGARDAVIVSTPVGEILVVLNYYSHSETPWEYDENNASAEDGSICLF